MATIYILQKLLSIIILFKFKSLYSFLCLFLFFVIFFFKADSYDIGGYTTLASAPGVFELFYSGTIDVISSFVADNRTVIYIYQLLFVCVASSIIFFFKENRFLILAILLSSVAIMLGVHNNLRQGSAALCMLLGIISHMQGYKKTGILFILASLGFHSASIFFIIIISILGIIYKFFIPKSNTQMYYIYILTFLLVLASTILISIIISSSGSEVIIHGRTKAVINLPFTEFGRADFGKYFGMDLVTDYSHRVNHRLKMLILFLFWLVTEFLIKFRSVDRQVDFLRYLRQFFLFFVVFLSFFSSFNEIGNRILYMYYVIEMGLLCFFIDRKMFKITVFILIGYGFAFNVWTILGGI